VRESSRIYTINVKEPKSPMHRVCGVRLVEAREDEDEEQTNIEG